jgi:hypothetical protein
MAGRLLEDAFLEKLMLLSLCTWAWIDSKRHRKRKILLRRMSFAGKFAVWERYGGRKMLTGLMSNSK